MKSLVVLLLTALSCAAQGFSDASAPFLLSTSSLRKGLVGYWRLEGGAPLWKDESKYGNDLTNSNSVAIVTGIQKNCGNFIASSNQVLWIADNTSLHASASGGVTVSMWFKATTVTNVTQELVTKYGNGGNAEFALVFNNPGKVNWFISTNGTTATSVPMAASLGNLATNTWYHVTGSFNGADRRFYVGVNLVTNVITVANSPIMTSGSARFMIGARQDAAATEFANGAIDEVGVWNRFLTDAERIQLYNHGLATHFPWAHP